MRRWGVGGGSQAGSWEYQKGWACEEKSDMNNLLWLYILDSGYEVIMKWVMFLVCMHGASISGQGIITQLRILSPAEWPLSQAVAAGMEHCTISRLSTERNLMPRTRTVF
jgi:hypothetical protein